MGGPVRVARRAAVAVVVAAIVGATACEVPAPTAPPVTPGLVVFGVLSPEGSDQVVLLMESRAAVPDALSRPFIAADPILSSGETPVTGAHVVITNAAGDSAVLVEDRDRRSDRFGAGVYRLWPTAAAATAAGAPRGPVLPVVAGGVYRLHVDATVGIVRVAADASTRVPSVGRLVTGPTRAVNLRRDTVLVPETPLTAAGFIYSLRAGNGVTLEGDPQYRRVLEPRLVLPAGNDWAFAYARGELQPGTRHVLTVTAADSNYYAYYSADLDPFADRTGRTSLRGASGVFGSAMTAVALPIVVTVGATP